MRVGLNIISIIIMTAACTGKQPAKKWIIYINQTGTYSSPRTADLNGDGVSDIVMGSGGKEEVRSDTAVIAVDGKTGKILWSIPGVNQFVGSAVFSDITGDGRPDVFIGGRWAQLVAINGADGKIIWSFNAERKKTDGSDGGWYNFTTPQWIPDQDGDKLPDLVVANGGDARADAEDTNRPAGRILVISSKTGKILANVTTPDRKETYMSVVCQQQKDSSIHVLIGTGGESIGGHLYRTALTDIMKGDISKATVLATGTTKGFVASPVLADINKDGTHDIVINTAEGKMLAINGATDSLLWQLEFPGTEAYTMPAVGLFTKDSVPDVFANFAIGTFPVLNYSVRFMVDGKTGRIHYRDTLPAFQYASAVAADLDGDGYDEVIVNQSLLKRKQFEYVYFSRLQSLNFQNNTVTNIADSLPATNLASTPWLGDLDGDGKLDIISSAVQYHDTKFDLQTPLGLYIRRFSMDIPVKRPLSWGAFMGSDGKSVY